MLRWLANKSIKHGYQTHRVGKVTKRTGLGVAGAGLGLGVVHGGATLLATGGVSWGALGNTGNQVRHLWNISNIEHRIPAVGAARSYLEPHFVRAKQRVAGWASKRWLKRTLANKPNRAKGIVRLAEKLRFPAASSRLLKVGGGVALAGYGIEKIGGAMLRHGYSSHPEHLKRKTRRFFGLKPRG